MTVLLALLMDAFLGEPPAALHPVVWIGHYLRLVGRGLTGFRPVTAFLLGSLWWCLGAAGCIAFAFLAQGLLDRMPSWLALVAGACLLKPLFSFRLLLDEVRGVEQALSLGLDQGRSRLSRIVSRDTSGLSESEVRESALESLSENLNDSVVAPLFWFLLLGLPGVALHRFANTADAMWGYRGSWEWAGKWAAVADDVLGWVPARLSAGLLLLIGLARPAHWRRLPAEARLTPSPNSGWPMAALALSQGLRLGKPGVYVLGLGSPAPSAASMAPALRCVRIAGWAWGLLVSACLMLLGGLAHA